MFNPGALFTLALKKCYMIVHVKWARKALFRRKFLFTFLLILTQI